MKIDVTHSAFEDLKNIQNYISYNLNNPQAANRSVGKIIKTYSQLADFPFIGTPLNSKISVNSSYRFLICEKYLIFYIVKKESVVISRIINGRQNYIDILFKDDINLE